MKLIWKAETIAALLAASGGAAALAYVVFGPKSVGGDGGLTRGLQNLGNTCFMNAILQALAANKYFVSWLEDIFTKIPPAVKVFMPMNVGVHEVLQALSRQDTTSVHCPEELLRALASHGWRTGGEEQDAHELFHIVMMALLHELTVWLEPISPLEVGMALQLPPRELPSRVSLSRHSVKALPFRFSTHSNPLDGLLVSKMKCCTCYNERPLQYSHFGSLSLLLPRAYWSSDVAVPLSYLLRSFCQPDTLEGVECDPCARLLSHFRAGLGSTGAAAAKARSNFVKQVSVGRLPRCLCLHVQRLYWLPNGMPWKSQTKVVCPELLDMSPYTHSSLQPPSPSGHSKKSLYRLKSIIVHRGGSQGGHYVTYRCGVKDHTRWCCVSDSSVQDVTAEEALSCAPYMAFYERMETNSLLPG